jgi:hypothetical protein
MTNPMTPYTRQTIDCPSWAHGQFSLITRIIDERPEALWITRHEGESWVSPKYKGANARALRKVWEDARTAAMDANDRPLWLKLTNENPDDLIDRLLREAQLTECVGDPMLNRRKAA